MVASGHEPNSIRGRDLDHTHPLARAASTAPPSVYWFVTTARDLVGRQPLGRTTASRTIRALLSWR